MAKRGEWGGAGRQHRPHSCHRPKRDAQDRPALTNLRVSLTGETALSRSFGRSEGNRTSQLLVLISTSDAFGLSFRGEFCSHAYVLVLVPLWAWL